MAIEIISDDVRIEQRFSPTRPIALSSNQRGRVAYKSGRIITVNVPNVDASGNPVWGWVIYKRTQVVDGINPWSGESTTEEYVWMPVEEHNSVEEARQRAQELAGT